MERKRLVKEAVTPFPQVGTRLGCSTLRKPRHARWHSTGTLAPARAKITAPLPAFVVSFVVT